MNNENNQTNWWNQEKKPLDLNKTQLKTSFLEKEDRESLNNLLIKDESGIDKMQPEESLNQNIDEDSLMRAFIDKNIESLAQSFNFAAFFFGPLYLLYRKMIAFATIIFLINFFLTILGYFKQIPYVWAIQLFIFVFVGVITNRLYYKFALRNVRKIQNNSFKYNKGNVLETCKKKGGTSLIYVILGIIVYSLLATIILYLLFSIGLIANPLEFI